MLNNSPLVSALTAFGLSLLYFYLSTMSPWLPLALIFSGVVGYFVYNIMTRAEGIDGFEISSRNSDTRRKKLPTIKHTS